MGIIAENELEQLQNSLSLIEALEERNRAQVDSFIDEQDQWNSLDEEEKLLLGSKVEIEKRIEDIVTGLVGDWIGQKSMDG